MPKNLSLLLLCLIFTLSTGALTVFGANPQISGDKKTEKRLESMQQYRDFLKEYEAVDDPKVKEAIATSTKLLDEGISQGLSCVVETQTNPKADCTGTIKLFLHKVQVSYRLVKYYAILAGKPTV